MKQLIMMIYPLEKTNTGSDCPWIQLLNLCLKVRIFRWDIQMKSYKKLPSYHNWPDGRWIYYVMCSYMLSVKLIIIVWISIMARYKKQYAPSITGQGISTVVLLYKERAFRWHKDNTKSGYIHRRRTFSPLIPPLAT